MDHNYYIGVFEFTEGQWHTLKGGNAGYFAGVEHKMRAVDTRNLIAVAR